MSSFVPEKKSKENIMKIFVVRFFCGWVYFTGGYKMLKFISTHDAVTLGP